MDYSGFKKVHDDDSKAVLENKNGHQIIIAKKKLSPKYLHELKKIPLHAAQGSAPITTDEPRDERESYGREELEPQQPSRGVNIYVNGNQAPQQQPIQPEPVPEAAPEPVAPAPQKPQIGEMPPAAAQQEPAAPMPTAATPVKPAPVPVPQAEPILPQVQNAPQLTPQQIHAQNRQQYIQEDQAWQQDLASGHITPETYHSLFMKKDTLGKVGTLFGLLLAGAGSGITGQPNAVLQIMQKQIDNDLEAQKLSKGNAQNLIRLNQENELRQAQIPKLIAEGKLTREQAKLVAAEANQKAYALSQMQANRIAFHALVKNMEKLPQGSAQRQQAEQTLGMMYQAINSENFNIADRAAAAGALSSFGAPGAGGSEGGFQQQSKMLRMSGNTPLATDMEGKHFPGIKGQSSVPLSGADRERLNSGINFDRQLRSFIEWTKKHSGTLSPTDYKTGLAKAAEIQGAYRAATNGGIYREGEQNFISRIVKNNPTEFFNAIRVLPQLHAVAESNKERVDQAAKNLGFSGYSGLEGGGGRKNQSEEKSGKPTEGKTGMFNGKPVVFKGGKWSYVK